MGCFGHPTAERRYHGILHIILPLNSFPYFILFRKRRVEEGRRRRSTISLARNKKPLISEPTRRPTSSGHGKVSDVDFDHRRANRSFSGRSYARTFPRPTHLDATQRHPPFGRLQSSGVYIRATSAIGRLHSGDLSHRARAIGRLHPSVVFNVTPTVSDTKRRGNASVCSSASR